MSDSTDLVLHVVDTGVRGEKDRGKMLQNEVFPNATIACQVLHAYMHAEETISSAHGL